MPVEPCQHRGQIPARSRLAGAHAQFHERCQAAERALPLGIDMLAMIVQESAHDWTRGERLTRRDHFGVVRCFAKNLLKREHSDG
jgi:hypothetical protein